VFCSVLQCVAACYSVLQYIIVCCSVLKRVAVCGNVLQCIAACCSVPLGSDKKKMQYNDWQCGGMCVERMCVFVCVYVCV